MTDNDNQASGKITTPGASNLGGDETAKHESEFYSEIDSQRGKQTNPGNFANRPKEDVAAAGREGGKNSHRGSSNEAADDNQDMAAAA